MADVSLLEHIVKNPLLQNRVNYDGSILNCNILDLIDVRKELEIILDVTEENPNFINRCTPKINFNIHSTKDNLSLENHSKNHRFNSRPASYAFDNNSRKSDISDYSTFTHAVQNPCGRGVKKFVWNRSINASTTRILYNMSWIESLR